MPFDVSKIDLMPLAPKINILLMLLPLTKDLDLASKK